MSNRPSPKGRPARPAEPATFTGRTRGAVIEVGLVNNMPDTALAATERQFRRLVEAGAAGRPVRLHLFSIASVPRSDQARAEMADRYRDAGEIAATRLDALVVTGTEPRAPRLADEPYWADLAALIDRTAAGDLPTVFSCLAAHAAVQHLDGIARRPLAEKCSGMFPSEAVAADPLLAGRPGPVPVSHSRWNALDRDVLERAGYRVLAMAGDAGVDLFTRDGGRLVFFHGHPEYDATSIAREYRRDVGRYLAGERQHYPGLPAHYFDARTEAALGRFRALAEIDRTKLALADLPETVLRPGLAERAAAGAERLFRNWIDGVVADRAVTPVARVRAAPAAATLPLAATGGRR